MRGTCVLLAVVMSGSLALASVASAATTASVAGAELTVTGSAGADTITVRLPGDALAPPTVDTAYEVTDPGGVTVGAGCVQATMPDPADDTDPNTPPLPPVPDPNKAHCERGAVPRPAFNDFVVSLDGAGGDDTILGIAPLTIGDVVSTGDRSFITGGAGNDVISGSENDDVISGGAGDDIIDGDGGNDIISGWTVPVIADPFAPALKVADIGHYDGAIASVGAAGNDSVFGGGGSDILTDGDDTTETADVLSAFKCAAGAPLGGAACPVTSISNVDVPEEDFDELYWGHRTSAQSVTVDTQLPGAAHGVAGENDTLIGIRGVYSGEGNDILKGHDADVGNVLSGGLGNDQLDGRGGNDELLGGDGTDNIIGGAGGDIINPGGHISSSSATATTVVSDGADTVDGGAEGSDTTGDTSTVTAINDQITYAGRSDNLALNLNQTTGWGAAGENDSVAGVEDVTGGHGADTITLRNGLASVIESDPIAPETPHPGEPVLPSPPPSGYFANDTVQARNGAADTINCGDATDTDTVVADRTPADVLTGCENVDLPPLPPPPPPPPAPARSSAPTASAGPRVGASKPGSGSTTPSTATRARISGGRSGGRVTVSRTGSLRLRRHMITCPRGATCTVATTVSARLTGASARKARLTRSTSRTRRTYKLGGARYSVKAGRSASARAKLSMRGLAALKRLRTVRATVKVRVVRNGKVTTKSVSVSLRAPSSRA